MKLFEIQPEHTNRSAADLRKYAPKELDDDGPVAIANFIKKYAALWLSEVGRDRVVYRGLDTSLGSALTKLSNKGLLTAFIRPVRNDRVPKDSALTRHNAFNAAIQAAGCIANRSNSAFVSGRLKTAKSYGIPFVAIPIGKFNYTWSPLWADWLRSANLGRIMHSMTIDYANPASYDETKAREAIHDYDLLDAIASEHEIMLQCKKMLYIVPDVYAQVKEYL